MPKWYVVWVETGQEEKVRQRIEALRMDVLTLLPIQAIPYREAGTWTSKKTVLIPGYLFIRCEMNAEHYHLIRGITHVLGWLGTDSMWPTDVPDDEMKRVKQLAQGFDPSRILENVKVSRHKRRGWGTLVLMNRPQQVTFAYNKQPEEAQVDAFPDAEDGEQTEDTQQRMGSPIAHGEAML